MIEKKAKSAAPETLAYDDIRSAMNYFTEREGYALVEGFVFPDANFPPPSDDEPGKGRVLVVIGTDEYYSVLRSDIIEDEFNSGPLRRVWIRRGAMIWRCKRAAYPFAEPLAPAAVLENLPVEPSAGAVFLESAPEDFLQEKGFAYLTEHLSPSARCVLGGKRWAPKELDTPLSTLFDRHTVDSLASVIFGDPVIKGCFIVEKDALEHWLSDYKRVHHKFPTLRKFVVDFGGRRG
jgi:hypothetical protein